MCNDAVVFCQNAISLHEFSHNKMLVPIRKHQNQHALPVRHWIQIWREKYQEGLYTVGGKSVYCIQSFSTLENRSL